MAGVLYAKLKRLRKTNVQKVRVEMTSSREIAKRSKKLWFSCNFELRFEIWEPRQFPEVSRGWVPREFPWDGDGLPEGSPGFPEGSPMRMGSPTVPRAIIFSCFLDAVLQNVIWPFGAQRKKRKLKVENIMQFS